MADETRELVTTRWDAADKALDKLDFAMCALLGMLDSYSENVANGLVTIMMEANEELRQYIGDVRAALVDREQGRVSAE